jgi:hypothetical protein
VKEASDGTKQLIYNALRCAAAVTVTSSIIDQEAQASTTENVTVSAGGGFDSNPFQGVNPDSEVASFRLELAPSISHNNGRTEVTLAAQATHIEYFGKYRATQNVGANLAVQHSVNERTEISAAVSASTSIASSEVGFISGNVGQLSPASSASQVTPVSPANTVVFAGPATPIVDDITLSGRQTRRNSASAQVSVSHQITDYDLLRWSSSATLQRYPRSNGLGELNFVAQQLDYTRKINSKLELGAATEVSYGDFRYTRFSDALAVSLQLTAKGRLNNMFEYSGRLGTTFSRINLLQGNQKYVTLSGDATLCYQQSWNSLCVYGQRELVPTAIGGMRTQTSIGTSFSTRLTSIDTLQTSVSYLKASAPLTGGLSKLESYRMFGRLERRLNKKMHAFVSAAYSTNDSPEIARRSNFQGLFGIAYSFGRMK